MENKNAFIKLLNRIEPFLIKEYFYESIWIPAVKLFRLNQANRRKAEYELQFIQRIGRRFENRYRKRFYNRISSVRRRRRR